MYNIRREEDSIVVFLKLTLFTKFVTGNNFSAPLGQANINAILLLQHKSTFNLNMILSSSCTVWHDHFNKYHFYIYKIINLLNK